MPDFIAISQSLPTDRQMTLAFDLRGLCLPGTAAYGNIDFGQILTDGSKQNLGRFEGCVSADGVDP
jgi:hypothetical protein